MKIGRQRKLTLVSGLGGRGESGSASTPFGPLKANLIISQTTQIQQLSELVSSLEREVATLNSKYCEAYVTLVSVMEHLVRLTAIINDTGGTKC